MKIKHTCSTYKTYITCKTLSRRFLNFFKIIKISGLIFKNNLFFRTNNMREDIKIIGAEWRSGRSIVGIVLIESEAGNQRLKDFSLQFRKINTKKQEI